MQFSEDELRALHAILVFAVPLLEAPEAEFQPSDVGGIDLVLFGLNDASEVVRDRNSVRDLVDPNGLRALKVKALDMLVIAEDAPGVMA